MTILIIDGWAYRTRNDGMMESTKVYPNVYHRDVPKSADDVPALDVTRDENISAAIMEDWQIRQPVEVGLSGGEYSTVHGMVKHIADLFPEGRTALPTSEGPKRTAANPEGM
jgi:hypothetical protein